MQTEGTEANHFAVPPCRPGRSRAGDAVRARGIRSEVAFDNCLVVVESDLTRTPDVARCKKLDVDRGDSTGLVLAFLGDIDGVLDRLNGTDIDNFRGLCLPMLGNELLGDATAIGAALPAALREATDALGEPSGTLGPKGPLAVECCAGLSAGDFAAV